MATTPCRSYDSSIGAQSLGFTLLDVATQLRSPEGESRKARVAARLEEKLVELDGHAQQVRTRRAKISKLLNELLDARTD